MLGTEADQGKGSLFPTLVQKGYVHMALVKRENKKSDRTSYIFMHLSAFKPEDTLKKIAPGRRNYSDWHIL